MNKLKYIYVIVHLDKDGNEDILAEPAIIQNPLTGELRTGGEPQLSPDADDLPAMEVYIKRLQEAKKDTGYKRYKIKKFIAEDNFN